MCGFASFGQNIDNKGLKIAFNQLKRRGPDPEGIWTDENVFLGVEGLLFLICTIDLISL